MSTFFLLTIMVVDIAALIYSPHPLTTRTIDGMLTPSQVQASRKQNQKTSTQESFFDGSGRITVHSQGTAVRSSKVDDYKQSEKAETETKRHQNHRSKNVSGNKNTFIASIRNEKFTKSNRDKAGKRKKLKSGNLPDVLWRHIPIEHVRKHPLFRPLPDPERIQHLESMEDVRNFRQDSWQWDVLHEGRMTTSQAVAALGFLEPTTGDILGVPKGLRRGGIGAYHRLRRPSAARTLEEMNEKLCVCRSDNNYRRENEMDGNNEDNRNIWTEPSNFPFAAKYMVKITKEEYQSRKRIAMDYAKSPSNQWSIRMVWGNVQEATSLLTALNYFWKRDKGVLMKEIGMCGAGLSLNQTSQSSGLILGATPDAVLCHPDGRIEAVEVKNHCPFVPKNDRYSQTKYKSTEPIYKKVFQLSRRALSKRDSIMCQYIPQLMMEMLCLGENCESAIMVRQTATHGSLILRVKRNDEWIDEMIYWLNRFYENFVQEGIPPPRNFFLESGDPIDRARYCEFLELTKRIEAEVELLEHVPHRLVQRAMAERSISTDLFFDQN